MQLGRGSLGAPAVGGCRSAAARRFAAWACRGAHVAHALAPFQHLQAGAVSEADYEALVLKLHEIQVGAQAGI